MKRRTREWIGVVRVARGGGKEVMSSSLLLGGCERKGVEDGMMGLVPAVE